MKWTSEEPAAYDRLRMRVGAKRVAFARLRREELRRERLVFTLERRHPAHREAIEAAPSGATACRSGDGRADGLAR